MRRAHPGKRIHKSIRVKEYIRIHQNTSAAADSAAVAAAAVAAAVVAAAAVAAAVAAAAVTRILKKRECNTFVISSIAVNTLVWTQKREMLSRYSTDFNID